MQEFKLPDLGEGMHEAEIARWLVKPGDTIKLDQPMVEVETDKALVEIPSPVSGRISDIRVLAGQVAKVGEVLVVFETPDDRSSTNDSGSFKSVTTNPATQTASASSSSISTAEASPPPKKRVLAAPAVRKLAFELGVDLEQVTASNPNGRVSIEDVQAYADRKQTPVPSAPPAEASMAGASPATTIHENSLPTEYSNGGACPPPEYDAQPAPLEERQPLTGLRKRIAEHMEHAWRTIPI